MESLDRDVHPFTISVPNDVLTDIRARLDLTRFPRGLQLPAGEEWTYGTPPHRVQELVEYWKESFDWRKIEADINTQLPQFTTTIDAEPPHGTLSIHFVHKRSSNSNAIPLVFVHGWPGNFLEVAKIIGPLTDPSDVQDPAFHVVAPSLPGFVFSEASKSPGLSIKATALMIDKLMKKLGYKHYIAQGGDWGAMIVKGLAVYHSDTCRGTHTNMPVIPPPTLWSNPIRMLKLALGYIGLPGGYSKRELEYLKEATAFQIHETGYMRLQGTKPQTLAYGLTDSPAALLAWIYEKLYSWTDGYSWTPDEIVTWVMLYWISTTGPVGGLRYYKEAGIATHGEAAAVIAAHSNVPLGVSVFRKELYKFPDDWCSMVQPVKYHKYHESGGHFAAYEKPELLVNDIRRFTEVIIRSDRTLVPK
ncbi:alpha/beta-hydrolase [Ramaria rubella]|nr:alpha/beta-hydrolase [Ramaria rubella]